MRSLCQVQKLPFILLLKKFFFYYAHKMGYFYKFQIC
jgi:hypothetical protein